MAQRPYGLGVQACGAHLCRVAGQGMQVTHDAAVGIARKSGRRNLLVSIRVENTAGLGAGAFLDACGLGGLNGRALGVVGAGAAYGNAEVPAGGGRIGGVLRAGKARQSRGALPHAHRSPAVRHPRTLERVGGILLVLRCLLGKFVDPLAGLLELLGACLGIVGLKVAEIA